MHLLGRKIVEGKGMLLIVDDILYPRISDFLNCDDRIHLTPPPFSFKNQLNMFSKILKG